MVLLLFEFVSVPYAGYLPKLMIEVFDQAKLRKALQLLLVVPMRWIFGEQDLEPRVLEAVGAIPVQVAAPVLAPVIEVVFVAVVGLAEVAVAVAMSVVAAVAKLEEVMQETAAVDLQTEEAQALVLAVLETLRRFLLPDLRQS